MFLFLFLIIDLYFLIPAVIPRIFSPTAELVIPIGISSKEANAKNRKHQVTTKVKIISVQYNLKPYQPCCASYSSIHFGLFLQ